MPREPDALLLLAGKPKPGKEEDDDLSMDPMEQKREAMRRMMKAFKSGDENAAAEAYADAYEACVAANESEEAEPYSEEGDDEGG